MGLCRSSITTSTSPRRFARRAAALSLFMAASLSAAEAAADDTLRPVFDGEPPDEGGARARLLLDRGREAAKKGRLPEAVANLRAAWDLTQTFEVADAMAQVEVKLEAWRDAAEHLSYCLKNLPATEKPARKKQLEKQLAQARAQVALLVIHVSVDGALVSIDGRAVGMSPMQEGVFVEAGRRTIEVRAARYEVAQSVVVAEKGASTSVDVKMSARAVATSPPLRTPSVAASASLHERDVRNLPWRIDRPTYDWIRPSPPPMWRFIPVGLSGAMAVISLGVVLDGALTAERDDAKRQRFTVYLEERKPGACASPANYFICYREWELHVDSVIHTNRTITWTVVGTIALFGAATFAIWPFGTGGHDLAPERATVKLEARGGASALLLWRF